MSETAHNSAPEIEEAITGDTAPAVEATQQDFNEILRDGLWLIFAFVGVAYFAITLMHMTFLPPPIAKVMIPISAASSAIGFGLSFLLKRHSIPHQWAHPLLCAGTLILACNVTAHVTVTQDPSELTNYLFIMVAIGLFFLSPFWLALSLGAYICLWTLAAIAVASNEVLMSHLYFEFNAFVLAIAAFTIRRRAHRRNIILQKQIMAREQELEGALRQVYLQNMAEKHSRAKSEFLANMNHELRTPLNAIIGFAEIMKGQMFGPLSERYREYVDDILMSGRNLLNVVNDILDLSKIETDASDCETEPFDLSEPLESSLNLAQSRRGASELTFVFEPGHHAATVYSDRRRLKQILINLLSNAVKFTPAGGTVTLRSSEFSDGRVLFEIEDTGIGMSEEQIAMALDPFWKADPAYATQFGGTGLGLPIAHRFVRQLGGDLTIHSTPDQGTNVQFWLPMQRPELAQAG